MNVRILARWIDDPTESPITLDAELDADRRIRGKWTIFGATDIDTDLAKPFALDRGGRMDFGAGRAEADRVWRADVRTKAIEVGARFSVTWSGGERGEYRIEKVSVPGGKAKEPGGA